MARFKVVYPNGDIKETEETESTVKYKIFDSFDEAKNHSIAIRLMNIGAGLFYVKKLIEEDSETLKNTNPKVIEKLTSIDQHIDALVEYILAE